MYLKVEGKGVFLEIIIILKLIEYLCHTAAIGYNLCQVKC